jgi:hypothetical protein
MFSRNQLSLVSLACWPGFDGSDPREGVTNDLWELEGSHDDGLAEVVERKLRQLGWEAQAQIAGIAPARAEEMAVRALLGRAAQIVLLAIKRGGDEFRRRTRSGLGGDGAADAAMAGVIAEVLERLGAAPHPAPTPAPRGRWVWRVVARTWRRVWTGGALPSALTGEEQEAVHCSPAAAAVRRAMGLPEGPTERRFQFSAPDITPAGLRGAGREPEVDLDAIADALAAPTWRPWARVEVLAEEPELAPAGISAPATTPAPVIGPAPAAAEPATCRVLGTCPGVAARVSPEARRRQADECAAILAAGFRRARQDRQAQERAERAAPLRAPLRALTGVFV